MLRLIVHTSYVRAIFDYIGKLTRILFLRHDLQAPIPRVRAVDALAFALNLDRLSPKARNTICFGDDLRSLIGMTDISLQVSELPRSRFEQGSPCPYVTLAAHGVVHRIFEEWRVRGRHPGHPH